MCGLRPRTHLPFVPTISPLLAPPDLAGLAFDGIHLQRSLRSALLFPRPSRATQSRRIPSQAFEVPLPRYHPLIRDTNPRPFRVSGCHRWRPHATNLHSACRAARELPPKSFLSNFWGALHTMVQPSDIRGFIHKAPDMRNIQSAKAPQERKNSRAGRKPRCRGGISATLALQGRAAQDLAVKMPLLLMCSRLAATPRSGAEIVDVGATHGKRIPYGNSTDLSVAHPSKKIQKLLRSFCGCVEGEWRARRLRRFSRRRMRAASRRLARFSSRGVCGDGGRAAAAGTAAALGSIGLIVAACLFSSGSPAVVDCLSSSDGVAVDGSSAVAGTGCMASVGPGVAEMPVLASSRRRAAAARARIDRVIALSMRGCRRVNTTVSASVN